MHCYSNILGVVLLNVLSFTQALPVKQDQLFLNDMAYSPKDVDHQRGNITSRTFLKDRNVWKYSTLHYSFGTGLDYANQLIIEKAMEMISKRTENCVLFRQTSDPEELKVVIYGNNDNHCSTSKKFTNNAKVITLAPKCMNTGNIQHELLHALGFTHMHNHPDRDNHVKIHIENLHDKCKKNFEQRKDADDLNEPYDYDSIMHYSACACSKNYLPTIVSLKKGVQIGQRKGLSVGDVRRLKKVYCPMKIAN